MSTTITHNHLSKSYDIEGQTGTFIWTALHPFVGDDFEEKADVICDHIFDLCRGTYMDTRSMFKIVKNFVYSVSEQPSRGMSE